MGKKLVIIGADFSENGIQSTKVFYNNYSSFSSSVSAASVYYGLTKNASIAYGIYGNYVDGVRCRINFHQGYNSSTMVFYSAKIESNELVIEETLGTITVNESGVVDIPFNKSLQVNDDNIIVFKSSDGQSGLSYALNGTSSGNAFNSSALGNYAELPYESEDTGIIMQFAFYHYE